MTQTDIVQLALYLVIVIILVKPLGRYMDRVYKGHLSKLVSFLRPVERLIYRCCGIDPAQEMDWQSYLYAMLMFNMLGILAIYLLQRLQYYLPFNPQSFAGVTPDLAFNTAASMVSNSGWQAYAGENTLSYFTQTLGITAQSFLSAATGMAILIAFIRGLARRETRNLGNYWQDLVRSILYILLPLSIIFAVVLTSQGVIQNYNSYQKIQTLENTTDQQVSEIPMGPVASLVAIRQLGSEGAGFFSVNAAHPFENPNTLTNYLEMLAIILIPAALCYTFGLMINDRRQGWMVLITMILIFVPSACMVINAEQKGNPALTTLNLYSTANMEGKEQRFGAYNSALWTTVTTGTGNGSTNAMNDSFMPMSGLVTIILMHLGGVVFGGVGSGLYGMLMLVIITVFMAGLMVGRTPEYLGNKIEPFEMKMVVLIVLIMPLTGLLLVAVASVTRLGTSGIGNPGAHGFTEILYAFTSMRNNNGSAFAGLNVNTEFYNVSGALLMMLNRYWLAIATLAAAGSLASKKLIPVSSGTLATHNFLFVMLLLSFIIILSVLSFLPTLALGPIAEYITMKEMYGV